MNNDDLKGYAGSGMSVEEATQVQRFDAPLSIRRGVQEHRAV